MKTKHTQGEWKVFDNEFGLNVCTKEGLGIAEISNGDYSTEEIREAEANAKLIAAAPELLEALNDLLNDIGGGKKYCNHNYNCICAGDKAKQAIKKATEK